MINQIEDIKAELRALGSPEKVKNAARFFKAGPGQYGEGDVFLGVTMPELRVVAKRHFVLSIPEAVELLQSAEHECRMVALLIWTYQYAKAEASMREAITKAYLANAKRINNWDLVDASAEYIVGPAIDAKNLQLLQKLAASDLIWERRIAMIATFHFTKNCNPEPALAIAELLLNDQEDLMQKAVGWMLREVGKRCGRQYLAGFLAQHYQVMPRTMLRYAIEHFAADERQKYLLGQI